MRTRIYKNIKYVTCFFPSSTTRRLLRAKRTDILSFSSVSSLSLSFVVPSPYPLPSFYLPPPLCASLPPDHVKTRENGILLTLTPFLLWIIGCFKILSPSLTMVVIMSHSLACYTIIK